MSEFLTYLFWPNPPTVSYASTKAVILFVVSIGILTSSFALKYWRKRLTNAVTKKLSRSWPMFCFWLGFIGIFLVVCRVEGISFLSMRIWWAFWLITAIIFAVVQVRMFRSRHYEVVKKEVVPDDPRDKYLPKQKKKK